MGFVGQVRAVHVARWLGFKQRRRLRLPHRLPGWPERRFQCALVDEAEERPGLNPELPLGRGRLGLRCHPIERSLHFRSQFKGGQLVEEMRREGRPVYIIREEEEKRQYAESVARSVTPPIKQIFAF